MQKYLKHQYLCQTHKQPLDLVCLDPDCQLKGMICSYCQYQSHKHSVRSLALLIRQISDDYQASLNSLTILSKMDQLLYQTTQQVKNIKSKEHQKIMRETITLYYQDFCNSLSKKQNQMKKFLNYQVIDQNQLNSFLVKYQFVSKEDNKTDLSNLEFFLMVRLEAFMVNYKELTQAIASDEPFQKLLTIFTIEDQKKVKYWFNPDKMHKQIILIDKSKVKIKDGYSYRIAVLDPPIRKISGKTQKKSCTFKIGTIGAMIGVGICYKKKVEGLSYIFSAYSQHGCYFVANNGYTYNQFEKTYNSQIKNWTFTSEDVIKVTIFPKQKKISFKKQGSEPFQYPYQQKPEFQMNFAAMMCSNNESVQVLHI